ncbi:hypothetical protein SCHPADRAFT_939009 [Schizopora paradoxa]|uniref:Bromo domain-containing protein n=1 Tax=Schizopora paradoxa TaxID=27342 RepID=A0A0H2RU84_9AGAM|nr:hypothetical protein SCHPADRAFT_939009 [Schizopora paradoxa]
MNNLLKSLESRRLKLGVPDGELRRLLGAVKESRGHESKLSDAFYESLEGIVQDLRTVTIDNRDAEAFLKPVSKIDYPDYYEIISNPMDLQTVQKKVKTKQYKSKKEFADDLDLIWSNCYTYNTGENHHLRQCVNRLREKANKLLKNVTDRKDRLDPPVPVEFGGVNGVKINGITTNGHSRKHSTPPFMRPRSEGPGRSSVRSSRKASPSPFSPREVSFQDMPAFVRTPSGMASFLSLDSDLETAGAGPSTGPSVAERLERYINPRSPDEEWQYDEIVNGDIGEKRKMMNGDFRPRKRSRTPRDIRSAEPEDLWWEATMSQDLLANGLPTFTHPSSFSLEGDMRIPAPPEPISSKNVKRRKRKRPPEENSTPRSLLGYINNNIRTLKRVRRTHDKFLALNLASEDGATGPNGQPLMEPPEAPPLGVEDEVDVQVDDRPWRSRGTDVVVEGEEADECMHWIGTKILEHSGFQSTSKAALDVFSGVATDFLLNVGRTIRFLCDNYSQTMSSEEIILHTLFESGIPQVQDLDRYITDDVVRYGTRLSELEKKLVSAYREVTTVEALDDDAFFAEDEDEEGELLMGNFADSFGEDFLGLRELGIASELGLSNLTIPKRLLKGKNKGLVNAQDNKPKEPPPPYPPPPPLLPLSSTRVEKQIGLLKNFYMRRFNDLASSSSPQKPTPFIPAPAAQPPRPLSPGSSLQLTLEMSLLDLPAPAPQPEQPPQPSRIPNPAAPPLQLPDDNPLASRAKIGPLGQILRPSASSGSSKKKAKPKENPSMAGMPGMIPGFAGPAPVVRPPPEGAVVMNGTVPPSLNGIPPTVTHSGNVSPAPGSQPGDSKKKPGGNGGGPNGAAGSGVAGKKKSETPLRPPFITASA